MTFLPIIARELRVAARRPGTHRVRTGAAMIAMVITAVVLTGLTFQMGAGQGGLLFSALSSVAFIYSILAGILAASDCLSFEKREGTLGLLFLTDLKGYDVVLGKLISCALGAFYGLLAIVPVLTLGVLLGGVSLGRVCAMALLFLNTLFYSMAAGIFASGLSRNDRRALFAAGCTVLMLVGAPFVAATGLALWRAYQGAPPNSLWELADFLRPSPAYAFQIVRTGMVSAYMRQEFFSVAPAYAPGELVTPRFHGLEHAANPGRTPARRAPLTLAAIPGSMHLRKSLGAAHVSDATA